MSEDTIAAALARAQGKFEAIKKGRTARVPTKNGGEYTYNYADIGDVLTAVRPVLAAEGIAVVQATEDTEHGCVLVTKLLWRDQSIEGRMPLPLENASPQQVGSLLTYYRRYGLTALIGVAAEDDDDGQAAQDGVKHQPARRQAQGRPSSAPVASSKQVGLAEKLLGELVAPAAWFSVIQRFTGRDCALVELTVPEASKLIDALQDAKREGTDLNLPEGEPDGSEPF